MMKNNRYTLSRKRCKRYSGKFKIALAQINPKTGDISGNTKKIIEWISRARTDRADIVVFPEMAISGYCVSDLVEDESFLDANRRALRKIALATKGIIVVVGFVDHDKNAKNEDGRMRKYNAAAVLSEGKIIGVAYKTLLPNYGVFDDKRFFSPADKRIPIQVIVSGKKFRLGISICEDMWDDNYLIKPVDELASGGADIIININASPFIPGKFATRKSIILRHVKKHKIPFVYVNTVGAQDIGKNILPFDGQSMVFDSLGNFVACTKKFCEELLIAEINIGLLENRHIKLRGLAVNSTSNTRDILEDVFDALVMALRDYAKKCGFVKSVVPVSGGIDSALGLVLTVQALGKENVVAYNLPSKYNTSATKSIAERLCRNLDVTYKIIPIDDIDKSITCAFEKYAHPIKDNVSKENIHARIRGLLMMIESNDSRMLLISNGNETEIGLGYSTLYGDMCGGVSVIGDLPKMLVYDLCKYYNSVQGKEIIPLDVFRIKPSAELSQGQYDPFDYTVISPLVSEMIEKRLGPKRLLEMFNKRKLCREKFLPDSVGKTVYDKYSSEEFYALLKKTYRQLRMSVYKRLQGPPIIVVSERAFGFDLRETIINGWDGE